MKVWISCLLHHLDTINIGKTCCIYIYPAFYDFQAEICTACFECGLDEHHVDSGKDCFSVIYLGSKRVFNVVFDPTTLGVDCSCKIFRGVGILCRHSLWILNAKGKTFKSALYAAVFCHNMLRFQP